MQKLDCAAKSATYLDFTTNSQKQLDYDYVIVATGVRRQWPVVPQVSTHVEYVREGLKHVEAVAGAKNGVVVVIGGGMLFFSCDTVFSQVFASITCGMLIARTIGAVGIEFAAEVALHHPTLRTILVHSRSHLLSAEPLLPDEFKSRALTVLEEEGVEVILGQRAHIAKEKKDGLSTITLTDGRILEAGFVIDARSTSTPSTSFLPREALNEDGYVKATHLYVSLQHSFFSFFVFPLSRFTSWIERPARLTYDHSMTLPSHIPNHASHFTIGDINDWSGIKRAGNAMSMAQIANVNVWSAMLSAEHSEKQQFKRSSCPSFKTSPGTSDDEVVQIKALAGLSLDGKNDEDNEKIAPLFPQAQFPNIPAVMGLAIGSNTVTWDGTDVKWGKDVMAASFGTDLGWKATLRYMGLSSEENVEAVEVANVEEQVDEVVKAERKEVDSKHVERVIVEELVASA